MAKIATFVELVEKFRSEADFVTIYIDEAHASDRWEFKNNYLDVKSHKCEYYIVELPAALEHYANPTLMRESKIAPFMLDFGLLFPRFLINFM